MHKGKIRVLIVEDSSIYQTYISQILETDDLIEIGGIAKDAAECLEMMETVKPDVITLDLALPDTRDLELLKELMKHYQTPVIVVSSDQERSQEALALGAKDFIKKISNGEYRSGEQFATLLKLKIKMYATSFTARKKAPKPKDADSHSVKGEVTPKDIIVIGASLGGTETSLEILKDLPVWMPGIVIVQHMAQSFTSSYADRLNRNCVLEVKEARNGDCVRPGLVLIAKGGEQLNLFQAGDGYRVRLKKNDGMQTFCPSVDEMFLSVAQVAGKHATAVILTGMGHDGALGMRKLHDAGAYTIAESRETCVVYGMPCAAVEAGGVDIELPKYQIAEALIKRFERIQGEKR